METRRKIILIATIIFILNSTLLILNKSFCDTVTDKYVSKKASNVSIKRIIYSKKFNKNKSILKLRNNVYNLYEFFEINHLDTSKIDAIVESKIFKETFSKITLNYLHSIRDNKYYKFFDIEDYYKIVDDNIDELLDGFDNSLIKLLKKPISNILKKMGSDIIEDIPTTEKVVKKIPLHKKVVIRLLLNKSVSYVLIIINLLLLISLIVFRFKSSLLSNLIFINIGIVVLLIIIGFIISFIIGKYNNEWSFIATILNKADDKILSYQILIGFITVIMISVYKIKKSIVK